MSGLAVSQIGSHSFPPVSSLQGRFALVTSRYQRYQRLVDLEAPDIILDNEKRMLAEAIDGLMREVEVEEIVFCLGEEVFAQYLDYIVADGIVAAGASLPSPGFTI